MTRWEEKTDTKICFRTRAADIISNMYQGVSRLYVTKYISHYTQSQQLQRTIGKGPYVLIKTRNKTSF